MITEILLLMFRGIIHLVISLLPAPTSLPSGLENIFTTITSYLEKINGFFPVDVLLQALGFLFAFEGGILLFKFFNFVLKKLRGSG